MNGIKIKQTSLANLANWDTWSTQAEILALNAGINTIAYKYDASDSGNVNLDQLVLTVSAAPTATATPVPTVAPTIAPTATPVPTATVAPTASYSSTNGHAGSNPNCHTNAFANCLADGLPKRGSWLEPGNRQSG